jgi:hypothetical protein
MEIEHPEKEELVRNCMYSIFKSIAENTEELIINGDLTNKQLLTIAVKVHRQEVKETN